MKSRQDWQKEQERLLAVYDTVRAELESIPGVREVGVGLRHRAGQLVEEAVFIVAVDEKRPESEVPPSERVPRTVQGFGTDVVVHREPILLIGFNDEDDAKNYKTKVGGISIGPEGSYGTGTLGCFCKQSDESTVLLSCHHVLFDGDAGVGSKVGQPKYDKKMCCTFNEIGKVQKGDKNVDCAIASLNSKVPFFPKVRRIKKSDGTVEEEGLIKGTAAPVLNQVVFKVGKRTGLTRGTISKITPRLEIDVNTGFSRFCNTGDSGSVVIEKATGKVVALLTSMTDKNGKVGLARSIASVEAVLQVTVLPSDPTATYTEAMYDEEEEEAFALPPASPFEALVERLRMSDAGGDLLDLFERHRDECLTLVQARRGFTIAWHRSYGPVWLAALGRSSRDPIYQIPDSVEGVPRAAAISQILDALRAEASDALRHDIDAVRAPLAESLVSAPTVAAWCDRFESLLTRP